MLSWGLPRKATEARQFVAHHKSAIKRIRRNNRANVRNNQYLTGVRTAVKKFRLAVSSAAAGTLEKTTVGPLFLKAQSLLAKAATKGLIHKNNASRKIGRLAALLKTLDGATGTPVAAAPKAAKKAAPAKKEPAAAAKPKAAPKAAKKPAK